MRNFWTWLETFSTYARAHASLRPKTLELEGTTAKHSADDQFHMQIRAFLPFNMFVSKNSTLFPVFQT